MKKNTLIVTFLAVCSFGISPATLSAQAVFGGNTTVSGQVVTNQYYNVIPTTQTCQNGLVISIYQACPPDNQNNGNTNVSEQNIVPLPLYIPTQTQVCPNGLVITIYQTCQPVTQYCLLAGSGWCSISDGPKVFEWPVVDPNSSAYNSAWSWQNNSYSSYSPSNTNNNTNYSIGWTPSNF